MAIETPLEGKNALINWLIDATRAQKLALPNKLLARLREYALEPSPVKAIVSAAELIYARADVIPFPELLAIGAELAALAEQHGFAAMAGGRGRGIARELRKREGVTAPLEPVPSAAPVPKADYVTDPVEHVPSAP
jgi:hypothetical protein